MKLEQKNLPLAIFCIAVIAGAVGFFWMRHRANHLAQAYAQVQPGDSQEQVIAQFGRTPGFISTALATNIDWDEHWLKGTNGINCTQFHFSPPLSLSGEEWVVGFNERNQAVEKFHIISP